LPEFCSKGDDSICLDRQVRRGGVQCSGQCRIFSAFAFGGYSTLSLLSAVAVTVLRALASVAVLWRGEEAEGA
jgi:hypothetical protein